MTVCTFKLIKSKTGRYVMNFNVCMFSLKRGSKTGKLDKSRSFLSGEDGVEENHFLGLIMSILREAMSGLTTTAEVSIIGLTCKESCLKNTIKNTHQNLYKS